MGRRFARVTVDARADLVEGCRTCLYWQQTPVQREAACGHEAEELDVWLSEILRDWGSCGRVLYVDDRPVGHALYVPQAYAPGSLAHPTAPVSTDAVLLTSLRVAADARGRGYGRLLVQAVAKDVLNHGGIKAIEAFGSYRDDPCLIPADFLAAVGFRTQREHVRTPRMRMDLRSMVSWKAELEQAVDRLLGVVRPPAEQPVSGRAGRSRTAPD